jgi:hypothetical protein
MPRIAVALPVYQPDLAPHEDVALALARKHLADYDCYLVHPIGLTFNYDTSGFRRMALSPRHFRSLDSYNRMLMRPQFWRRFADYDHVLIYQLDCLIFGGDLERWTRYSYVGAPWLRRGAAFRPKAVGNGGFSLRSVRDSLAVLSSDRARLFPRHHGSWLYLRRSKYVVRWFARMLAARCRAWRDGRPVGYHLARRFDENEDAFWSYFAPQLSDAYRLPAPREALGFAFESKPRLAYEANGHRLPLGCHAWYKFDAEFWSPFVEAENLP